MNNYCKATLFRTNICCKGTLFRTNNEPYGRNIHKINLSARPVNNGTGVQLKNSQ